jgi:hypothetical protein
MQPDIESDARFADMAKIRQARAMSPAEKFLAGPRLFYGVCERMKEGLRDENPGCDEETIHQLLRKRFQILRKLEDRNITA